MYRIGFIIIMILAILLGLLIGTLNSEPVAIDLLWAQLHWPLGLLILSALAVGLLIGLSAAWFFGILPLRMRLRSKSLNKGVGKGQALKNPHG